MKLQVIDTNEETSETKVSEVELEIEPRELERPAEKPENDESNKSECPRDEADDCKSKEEQTQSEKPNEIEDESTMSTVQLTKDSSEEPEVLK